MAPRSGVPWRAAQLAFGLPLKKRRGLFSPQYRESSQRMADEAKYIPKRNYQGAIFDAIERYLTGSAAILDRTPAAVLPPAPTSAIFVPAPVPEPSTDPIPNRLRELVRKFDQVERDYRSRALARTSGSRL